MSAPEVLSSVGLLDCPFCGHRPVFENLVMEAVIRCINCKARIVRQHSAKADTGVAAALNDWNQRTPSHEANCVIPPEETALNVRHRDADKAADAFWKYWRENGETHKHGYYESTWGAINRALRVVGVTRHKYVQEGP